jgi:hypothetical protein
MRRRVTTHSAAASAASQDRRRRPILWAASAAVGLGFLCILQSVTPLAETIRATPPFNGFEGTVISMRHEGSDLIFDVQAGSDVHTVRLSGLPNDASLIACGTCRVVSRVEHSPRGPSQVITFFEGERTIAAIGINTAPGVGVLSEDASRSAEPAVRLKSTKGKESGTAQSMITAPGLDLPIAAGEKVQFKALDKDWALQLGRSTITDISDIVGANPSREREVRTDWLLLPKM